MTDSPPSSEPPHAASSHNDLQTRASMFDRLKTGDATRRDLEWEQFRRRYAPVVAGFARNMGVRPQDVDDVIQDVFLSFFLVSPRFEYDRAKGRFRGYLKTVTVRAIRARFGRAAKVNEVPLADLPDDAPAVQETWDRAWADQLMRRAVEAVRLEYAAHPKTFEAFERYALRREPVADVARDLGMTPDGVYQGKHRMLETLRAKVKELDLED